jgi:putative NIF3 family GTP cyclohydrolase 1 type 2
MMRMALLAGSTMVGAAAPRGMDETGGLTRGAGEAVAAPPGAGMTVRQVIAALLADIPGAPFPNTVDTIKAGSADQKVTGIVTTMFATNEVIARTIRLGANFIIAHEPTFYNHTDETKWLGDDAVLKAKQGVLMEHGIAVWRFHDGIHRHNPDGIRMGVMQALGWEKLYNPGEPPLVVVPPASLGDILALLKKNLGIEQLKYIGDVGQTCSKLVLLPGAPGGQSQIGAIQKYDPDLLIVGELNEWETSEYVRDARYLVQPSGAKVGNKEDRGEAGPTKFGIALVVLGHSVSEEPGMEWLVAVLQQKAPGIPVTHVVSGDAFSWG